MAFGTEDAGPLLRGKLARARESIQANGRVQRGDNVGRCPASVFQTVSNDGIVTRCGVTDEILREHESPVSMGLHCFADYESCPVWRKEREAMWARKKGAVDLVASTQQGGLAEAV